MDAFQIFQGLRKPSPCFQWLFPSTLATVLDMQIVKDMHVSELSVRRKKCPIYTHIRVKDGRGDGRYSKQVSGHMNR